MADLLIYEYHLANQILDRHVVPLADIASTQQISLIGENKNFNQQLKLAFGTAIYEEGFFDNTTSIASQLLESSGVACQLITKNYPLGDSQVKGRLTHLILEYSSYDKNPIVITPILDGQTSPPITVVPSDCGFNRFRTYLQNHLYAGVFCKFQFDFTQNVTAGNVPTALYRMLVVYELEQRLA